MCKLCQAEGILSGQLERVTLANTNPGHYKRYTLWIEELEDGTFAVKAAYGPIGKWKKEIIKGVADSMKLARVRFAEVHDQKISRGYIRRVCDRIEEKVS